MSALFNLDPYAQQAEPINARAVGCPTCGASIGRPCKRERGTGALVAHQARLAVARHVAGLADAPTPRLFQEA